jgi:hypothetical protein
MDIVKLFTTKNTITENIKFKSVKQLFGSIENINYLSNILCHKNTILPSINKISFIIPEIDEEYIIKIIMRGLKRSVRRGHFSKHHKFKLDDVIDDINDLINNNGDGYESYHYSEKEIKEFAKALRIIRKAV